MFWPLIAVTSVHPETSFLHTINLKAGFWLMLLHHQTSLFKTRSMLMSHHSHGPSGAPANFQRLMETVFHGLSSLPLTWLIGHVMIGTHWTSSLQLHSFWLHWPTNPLIPRLTKIGICPRPWTWGIFKICFPTISNFILSSVLWWGQTFYKWTQNCDGALKILIKRFLHFLLSSASSATTTFL